MMGTDAQPDWPYLTGDVPSIPLVIRKRFEDFEVEEIPAYEPCGEGGHVYFWIKKTGIATRPAVGDIARALGVPPHAIGVAGLKDARGIAKQMLSVEGVDPKRVQALALSRIKVLSVSRHRNKLRTGHLRGNRFALKLRGEGVGREEEVRSALEVLVRRGVPNYFGTQRFGLRGDTGRVGEALLKGKAEEAVRIIAGNPAPADEGGVLRARRLFMEGRYHAAASVWPHAFRENARLCRAMARYKGNADRAVGAVGKSMLRFYVSAYQSWLFNQVVAARIDAPNRLMKGDLAYLHDRGAVFFVEEPAREQARADRFEISPTGPLFGPRMSEPGGEAARIEGQVLDRAGIRPEDFDRPGPLGCAGGRRPLRFKPEGLVLSRGGDEEGPHLHLRFSLPSGCYATALLREVAKKGLVEGEG
jgi:tRNA pseudouridine13 synthase